MSLPPLADGADASLEQALVRAVGLALRPDVLAQEESAVLLDKVSTMATTFLDRVKLGRKFVAFSRTARELLSSKDVLLIDDLKAAAEEALVLRDMLEHIFLSEEAAEYTKTSLEKLRCACESFNVWAENKPMKNDFLIAEKPGKDPYEKLVPESFVTIELDTVSIRVTSKEFLERIQEEEEWSAAVLVALAKKEGLSMPEIEDFIKRGEGFSSSLAGYVALRFAYDAWQFLYEANRLLNAATPAVYALESSREKGKAIVWNGAGDAPSIRDRVEAAKVSIALKATEAHDVLVTAVACIPGALDVRNRNEYAIKIWTEENIFRALVNLNAMPFTAPADLVTFLQRKLGHTAKEKQKSKHRGRKKVDKSLVGPSGPVCGKAGCNNPATDGVHCGQKCRLLDDLYKSKEKTPYVAIRDKSKYTTDFTSAFLNGVGFLNLELDYYKCRKLAEAVVDQLLKLNKSEAVYSILKDLFQVENEPRLMWKVLLGEISPQELCTMAENKLPPEFRDWTLRYV